MDVFDPRSAAIAGDRLFLCQETAFAMPPTSPFRGILAIKGQDVGVLSDAWLVVGGRRIWTDQAEEAPGGYPLAVISRGRDGNGARPAILAIAADGTLVLALIDGTVLAIAASGRRPQQGRP